MLRTKREARGWVTKPGARRRLLGTRISIAGGGGITATVKSGRTNTSFAKVPHRKRSFARQDEDHDQERHNRRHAPKDLQDLLREIADASRVPGFCPKRCRARPSSEHRGCGRLAVSPTGSRVGPFIVAGLSPRRSP